MARVASVLVLSLLVAGCDVDVLLWTRPGAAVEDAGAADAGREVGEGTTDGGGDAGPVGADAGSSDAGSADAGTSDAGTADAGTSDAGTSDAGTSDAGTSDAGTSDAGTSDAGTSDAGPILDGGAALTLELLTNLVFMQGEEFTFTARVTNDGSVAAPDASVVLTWPAGVVVLSAPGCADAGQGPDGGAVVLACELGVVGATSHSDVTIQAQVSVRFGWHDWTGVAAALALTDLKPFAVTDFGTHNVPIVGPRTADFAACAGPAVTSFAQCTPASLLHAVVTFLEDGGLTMSLDGGVAPYTGYWGQSAGAQSNFAFRLLAVPTLARGAGYSGQTVSPLCFEGITTPPPPSSLLGAWQACMN